MKEMAIQTISPFLWFDTQALEAAEFYVSVFKNSKIGKMTRYPEQAADRIGREPGSVITVEFVALNGGPNFKFTEAVSFVVMCETQEEVDYYWEKLTADGGEPGPCSWLKDKYGLSWQVAPSFMTSFFQDYKSEKAQRTMEALMKMKKLNIEKLQQA